MANSFEVIEKRLKLIHEILKIGLLNLDLFCWGCLLGRWWLAKWNSNLSAIIGIRVWNIAMNSYRNYELLKLRECTWRYYDIVLLFNLHVKSEFIWILVDVLVNEDINWVSTRNSQIEIFSILKSFIVLDIQPLISNKVTDFYVSIRQYFHLFRTVSLLVTTIAWAKSSCIIASSVATAASHIATHYLSSIAVCSICTMTRELTIINVVLKELSSCHIIVSWNKVTCLGNCH